tara:strand:+ start:756 stop:1343 length:588 start_codon:yes stop_codon:yes gene_type:complete
MANKDAPFGLKPTRMIGGGPYNGGQSRYRIASNATPSIFQGDLVVQVADGTIARYDLSTASGGAVVLGVFNGCRFTDPNTKKETFQNFYKANTVTADTEAFVIDNPNVVFEVQSDEAFAVTALFANFKPTAGTGSTFTGQSGVELDFSTLAATAALPLKAIDISLDPDNDDTTATNTNVLCVIANHVYGIRAAGV